MIKIIIIKIITLLETKKKNKKVDNGLTIYHKALKNLIFLFWYYIKLLHISTISFIK